MPDGDEAMSEQGHAHVDMHPQRSHEASNGTHGAEDGHIPCIVEHAGAVRCQAVCVQAKVPGGTACHSGLCTDLSAKQLTNILRSSLRDIPESPMALKPCNFALLWRLPYSYSALMSVNFVLHCGCTRRGVLAFLQ